MMIICYAKNKKKTCRKKRSEYLTLLVINFCSTWRLIVVLVNHKRKWTHLKSWPKFFFHLCKNVFPALHYAHSCKKKMNSST